MRRLERRQRGAAGGGAHAGVGADWGGRRAGAAVARLCERGGAPPGWRVGGRRSQQLCVGEASRCLLHLCSPCALPPPSSPLDRCAATRWRCCARRTTRSFCTTCCSWCRCDARLAAGLLALPFVLLPLVSAPCPGWQAPAAAACRRRVANTQPHPPSPQALRYEAGDDSQLARFLVGRATRSLTVASFLFWYLLTELGDDTFGPRAACVQVREVLERHVLPRCMPCCCCMCRLVLRL